MLFKKYKSILHLFCLVVTTYILHKAVFSFFKLDDHNFHYSLEVLYAIFSVFALILLIIALKFKRDKFDSIGMFFMLGTGVQMVLSYLVMRPILSDKIHNIAFEKRNFFVTFILFLLFETILTIRLLNEKH